MGKLFGLCAYLSGPMEKTADLGREIRKPVASLLTKFDVIVLDPSLKDLLTPWVRLDGPDLLTYRDSKQLDLLHQKMKRIRSLDLDLVRLSDFVVVVYDPNIPTVGTWEEIHVAKFNYKPVLFLCEKGYENVPLWVYGMLPPSNIFPSLQALDDYLKAVDEGQVSCVLWECIYNRADYQ